MNSFLRASDHGCDVTRRLKFLDFSTVVECQWKHAPFSFKLGVIRTFYCIDETRTATVIATTTIIVNSICTVGVRIA